MPIGRVKLVSRSPYSQSRAHDESKKDKEKPDAYDQRTWRHKAHYLPEAPYQIFIPAMALKFCITDAAAYLGERITGRGAATYKKHFTSGILVLDNALIDAYRDKVESVTVFANARGMRAPGPRVKRTFPIIPTWSATVDFQVVDSMITEDVFARTLAEAGKFIGLGRFRPQNGGFLGRFLVDNVEWIEDDE